MCIPGAIDGDYLGMWRAWAFVRPFTEDPAFGVDDHGAHPGVGMGVMGTSQLIGPQQEGADAHSGSASIDAVGGAWLLLGELLHLHRDGRRLPLGPYVTHVGGRYTQGE